MDESFIALLRDPDSGAELEAGEDCLISRTGERPRRYLVEDGIPVLLPRTTVRPGGRSPQESISRAFRDRSASYFDDNYGAAGASSERMARHALVEEVAQRIAPGGRVLEGGAGPLVLADVLRVRASEYVALDLSIDNLREGRARVGPVNSVVGDLGSLPIRDEAFDAVFAIGCLEYVPEMGSAVRQLCRVTRAGGVVVASFANRRSPRRWWEETVVHRLARARQRLRGEGDATYRRRLVTAAEATSMFASGGARVESVTCFNSGLIGYPLARFDSVQSMQTSLAQRSERVRSRASELLVVARKD